MANRPHFQTTIIEVGSRYNRTKARHRTVRHTVPHSLTNFRDVSRQVDSRRLMHTNENRHNVHIGLSLKFTNFRIMSNSLVVNVTRRLLRLFLSNTTNKRAFVRLGITRILN